MSARAGRSRTSGGLGLVLGLALAPACGPAAAPTPSGPGGPGGPGAGSAAKPELPPYASAEPLREPRIFAPGVVSTEAPEFSLSFEPDGKTAYFNRTSADRKQLTIHVAQWKAGRWVESVAPFSGTHRDIDPFVTPDGRRLYFSSDRPRPGAPERKDFDLWYMERDGGGWSEPRHIAGSPNDPEEIGFMSLTRDGVLYFDAFRGTQRGMFRAAPSAGGFAPPESLAPATASNPMIAPDGSFLVFAARMEGGFGEADLYVMRRADGGGWSEPRNLGPAVNTSQREFAPGLSPDGRYLFFTSERPGIVPAPAEGRPPGDLYQVEVAAVLGAI